MELYLAGDLRQRGQASVERSQAELSWLGRGRCHPGGSAALCAQQQFPQGRCPPGSAAPTTAWHSHVVRPAPAPTCLTFMVFILSLWYILTTTPSPLHTSMHCSTLLMLPSPSMRCTRKSEKLQHASPRLRSGGQAAVSTIVRPATLGRGSERPADLAAALPPGEPMSGAAENIALGAAGDLLSRAAGPAGVAAGMSQWACATGPQAPAS